MIFGSRPPGAALLALFAEGPDDRAGAALRHAGVSHDGLAAWFSTHASVNLMAIVAEVLAS